MPKRKLREGEKNVYEVSFNDDDLVILNHRVYLHCNVLCYEHLNNMTSNIFSFNMFLTFVITVKFFQHFKISMKHSK